MKLNLSKKKICNYNKKDVCFPLYCIKVRDLLYQAKEVLNEEPFILLGIDSYFFVPLEESLENCEISKVNYIIASNFINSLVKSFS